MRILHFEYSDFFRRVVHDLVLRSGHAYFETKKGSDLFRILAHDEIDVIFTGMELSDMSGENLIQDLKESKFKSIPVVILTSSEVDNLNKRLKGLDFYDFILKENLNIDTLNNILDRIEDMLEAL
ncbi:response regulator [Fusibacter ferrireducens]|uniref:Stage 0 sporulation protein A homolog n=1 Tax=Fusibacter ferrireducens TaxID=2785058 RepID=A0ABR9ZZW9_9FIRM|nr:response regulator [Fusibacter ferrireducens]MBF4695997.1 response regulator [Fusibacter ferrireducens]